MRPRGRTVGSRHDPSGRRLIAGSQLWCQLWWSSYKEVDCGWLWWSAMVPAVVVGCSVSRGGQLWWSSMVVLTMKTSRGAWLEFLVQIVWV